MNFALIRKALDDGFETVDQAELGIEVADLILDAEKVCKARGPAAERQVDDILRRFHKILHDRMIELHSSDDEIHRTEMVLRVAFDDAEGRGLLRELLRIQGPEPVESRMTDPNILKGDGYAAVAARARQALSATVRLEKARGGAAWGATWRAETTERLRQMVLKDLLADHVQARATFHTSSGGRALYDLVHAPAAGLGFDAAVDQLEELSPGWVDSKLDALGGNIAKSDTAIAKIEAKAVAIQKASTDMTIEEARAKAWKDNPDLYQQYHKERGAYIRANK